VRRKEGRKRREKTKESENTNQMNRLKRPDGVEESKVLRSFIP
jgi:hypothetical protein